MYFLTPSTAKKLLILLVAAVFFISCSKFRRIERSEDWRLKYEAGQNYFKKKDYYHTAILFEQILPIVRGLPEGEKVEFYLAYCQYYQKTYLLASNQFKVFFETYGRSQLAEEAYFMYAYSLYIASPDEQLDQKSSIEAMGAMQNFLNQFPGSQFSDKATEVINKSQVKLEKKEFENALLYLRMRYYQAAIICISNFRKTFPDSKYLEQMAFYKIEAQFKLAEQSIPSKQLERYHSTLDFYQEMLDSFPNSAYLKEAQPYYTASLNQVNLLKIKTTKTIN
ncbi:MAG: outer membrane protein assembly factor BamD [Bacteroidetes bacterium]|nr:outer membrane protein assembly factor BamD [Bacteroidota bacterium]